MSPVPGGMSTTRKSGSSQCTSVRNCSSALCSIGPRHTTGWSSRAKKPIEMRFTPFASGGMITSSRTTGAWSMPSMRGIEKPHTSASTAATLWPRRASETARLVVTDDFPTPPFPDATASTRVRASVNGFTRAGRPSSAAPACCCRRRLAIAWRCSSSITVRSTATDSTPSRGWTASLTRRVISGFSGQPATVRATVTATRPPSMATSLTMSRSTIDWCSSGSSTGRSASRTAASVGMGLSSPLFAGGHFHYVHR